MSGPEFEGVLARHRPRVEATGFIHGCSCDEWDRADLTGTHAAHLSAALHAELARWLGDEGTRERVSDAFGWHLTERTHEGGCVLACGYDGEDMDAHLATAALAALTTTNQEDHR